MKNLEIGLISFLEMQTNVDKNRSLYNMAKDAELEINRLVDVPEENEDIDKFITKNMVINAGTFKLKFI